MTGPSLAYRNQGDNLLYFAVGEVIRAHYCNRVEITAFSATPDTDRITSQAPWLKIVNPRREPLRAARILLRADVYFIAGAIPFHDNLRLMAQQFLYALVCRVRGRKVIVNAVSVQPIETMLCRLLFRWTVRIAHVFTVRDEGAATIAEALGVRVPMERAVDPGFIHTAAEPTVVDEIWRAERLPERVRVTGIGPRLFLNHGRYADPRYHFKNEYEEYSDEELDDYYKAMAAVADELACRGPVVFVSLSTRLPPGDDRQACRWIIARMQRSERAYVIEGEYSAAELMGILSRFDLYISTRLHGYALSVGAGVPTIAVEFHPKMRGLAQELDVEDWVIPLRGMDSLELSSVARMILGNLEVATARLHRNLRLARKKAIFQITDALP